VFVSISGHLWVESIQYWSTDYNENWSWVQSSEWRSTQPGHLSVGGCNEYLQKLGM